MGVFAGNDISRLASLNSESVHISGKHYSKSTDVSSLRHLHLTGCECANHRLQESSTAALHYVDYSTNRLNVKSNTCHVCYDENKKLVMLQMAVFYP